MKKLLMGGVAIAAIATGLPAVAADLPRKAPPYKAAPVAMLNWTGCYIGGNVGYGRAHNEYSPDPTALFLPAEAPNQTIDGVVGGGQIGCDYQFDPFVVGIQGMFDATSMSGTGDPYISGKTLKASVPWLATLTGRVGYAFQPNLLAYVKGGGAWARTNFDFLPAAPSGSGNVTRSGWTVGGGFEWMFMPNWSVFLEYNHLDFGNRLETFTNINGIASMNMNFKQNIDLVQLGVNYRFNWWR